MPEETPAKQVDSKQQANEVIAAVDAMLSEALKSIKVRSGDQRMDTGSGDKGTTFSTTGKP